MIWIFSNTVLAKFQKVNFDKFESYLDPDINAIFITTLAETEYVYGVFFAPNEYFEEVAKDFKNINFDEIAIAKNIRIFLTRNVKIF